VAPDDNRMQRIKGFIGPTWIPWDEVAEAQTKLRRSALEGKSMSATDTLALKPWLDLEPRVIRELKLPKGFVTDEERQCYHYLARHCVTDGQIVDGGACLGASAFAFASGLALNDKAARGSSFVHSYDQFQVSEGYVGDMIKQSFRPLASEWWDDFFDIFEFQTGKYKEFIRPCRGDFLQEKWNGAPIDILFVDIAKTPDLHVHVVEQFFPSLRAGRSLVLQQDFYFCWLPYIHITMQYLAHRFEIVDPFIPSASRLYLYKDAVTAEEIAHIRSIPRDERIDLLDAFIDGEQGDLRAMARVTKMCQLWHDKDERAYQDERDRLVSEFGLRPETNWGNQCAALDKLGFEGPAHD
jgi:hypothetical protein